MAPPGPPWIRQCVDHNVLVAKLTVLGLLAVIMRRVYSFLSNRRQRVKIGDVVSEWLQMSAGICCCLPWAPDIHYFD